METRRMRAGGPALGSWWSWPRPSLGAAAGCTVCRTKKVHTCTEYLTWFFMYEVLHEALLLYERQNETETEEAKFCLLKWCKWSHSFQRCRANLTCQSNSYWEQHYCLSQRFFCRNKKCQGAKILYNNLITSVHNQLNGDWLLILSLNQLIAC